MISIRMAFAITIVGLTTVSVAQSLGAREDETAIQEVIVEMTDGFNKHDAHASTRMYKSDADFVSVRVEVGIGREAAEKGLRRIFETRARTATMKTEDVKIRFIRPDVALAHVTNELSGLVAPDGQTLPSHRELSLRVFVKDGGIWRVASFPQYDAQSLRRPRAIQTVDFGQSRDILHRGHDEARSNVTSSACRV